MNTFDAAELRRVLALPAGEVLDEIVAEVVLGWERTRTPHTRRYGWLTHRRMFRSDTPWFSKHNHAAGIVSRWMREAGHIVQVSSATKNGGFHVSISKADGTVLGEAVANSLALAVCRAAITTRARLRGVTP